MAGCNDEWFARRGAWLGAIIDRIPYFAQLTALPLVNDEDPAMSGFMSPFDPETLKHKFKDAKTPDDFQYTFGGSLGWFDLQACLTPSVPILETKVVDLKNRIPVDGRPLPFHLDAAVDGKNALHFGKIAKASPDEIYDACIWRLAEIVEGGSEAALQKMMRSLRSITMRLFLLPTWDLKYAHMHNERTAILDLGEAVEQTCIQEVADVVGFLLASKRNGSV